MALDDLYKQAVQRHQAGELAAAESLYQAILQVQPGHPDATHLLGVIAQQRGDNARAVELISRAIAAKGADAAYYSNLAVALRGLNRLEDAVAQLREAIRLAPGYAGAHKNLGVTLKQLGRDREAARHLARALELNPNDVGACLNLAVSLLDRGRREEAAELLARAVRIEPNNPEALNNLGVVLKDLGQLDEAVSHLRRAVGCRPESAEVHNNLGTALSAQGKLPEAADCFREALRLDPDHMQALHNLGVALRDLGRLDEGIACLRQVLERNGADVEANNNMGAAVQALGDFAGARRHYERALIAQPDHVWAHFNRSTVLLGEGDFRQGWLDYEWRWKRPGIAPRRYNRPLWDGSPALQKRIVLYAEQGLGDTLQFVRYAALVRPLVGGVILECQELLLPLLARCKGIDRLVAKGAPLGDYDCHAALMTLPGILGTRVDSIPAETPYIFPDPALVEQWRPRVRQYDGLKVGINWQGNPKFQRDFHRSMPLAHFADLAQVPGVSLFSLQWGPGREQLTDGSADFPLIDFGDDLDRSTGAFMDRAAIMASLDLVVTSDTALAHLAGAMGMPTWVALSVSPDWRWFYEGRNCPWYPSMRLFRQPKLLDWHSVFARIAQELRRLIDARRAGR